MLHSRPAILREQNIWVYYYRSSVKYDKLGVSRVALVLQ